MRRLAVFSVAALVTFASGAAGQDAAGDACKRKADLAEMIECLGHIDTPRPFDDASGLGCARLDNTKFVRPAEGKRIIGFGDKTQYGSTSKGVVIEVGSEAQVVAPVDSLVVFADEFRSYGKLLILDPGCGVRFLLAGLAAPIVTRGQIVKAGQPLGVMMSVASKADANAPVLYVEMRRDQRPTDPGPDIAGQ